MRLDLRLQQLESCVQRVALELASLELELERLMTREHVALPHHRAECDPRREQQTLDDQEAQALQLRRCVCGVHIDRHMHEMRKQYPDGHCDDDAGDL